MESTVNKTKFEDLPVNELISLLTIIVNEKDKVYRYHPDNPKGISIEEEYDSLVKDIKIINELISKKVG
jgi:hypothetical protein